jgi:peptidyl-prolyl cis-trans isomerase D
MFDLFRTRAKMVRYLLGGILLLVAISMVVTLIPGFNPSTGGESQVVAEIGGEKLLVSEVQRNISAQMRNKAFPANMASIFAPQITDQMISEYAMAYQAQRMGFQVTEADLVAAIREILPQLFDGDNFAGQQAYAAVLAQQQMSIPQFENTLRKQLLIEKVQTLAVEALVISNQEAEAEFHRRRDKVKIDYIAIDPVALQSQAVVTPEEVKTYFDQNRGSFQIPPKRSLAILLIDEDRLAQSITVPEADVRRAYEANKESYRQLEGVHARHILLTTTDAPKEEIPKIRARAEELLKKLKGGADFAELARKYSQDPGSASKGGDLSWVVRGQTAKEFEDALFSLKPNQISDIVTTAYGFHIIQALEKREARLRTFDEVAPELAAELKKRLVYDAMQNVSDQAKAALTRDPQAAEKIAADLKIQLIRADRVGSGDPIPQIGVSRDLDEALATLRKNDVSPIVQVSPTRLAVAVVTEEYPARPAELREVEGTIRQQLIQQKLAMIVEERAKAAMQRVKAANGDLKQVAQAMGLEFKTTPEFTFEGAAEGLGSASYVPEAFTREVGSVFGPVEVGEKRFICKVTGKTPADVSEFAAARQDIVDEVKNRRARQRLEVLQDAVRNQLIKDGKLKINQAVIKRLVANYSNAQG